MSPEHPAKRIEILDAVRGAAIIGVVFGHVLQGLLNAGVANIDHWPVSLAYTSLHLVRMPLFALLAGTLVAPSVNRRGVRGYVTNRLELIGYQFILWSLIQGVAEVTTSSLKNDPVQPSVAFNLLQPIAHLWFLPFILLASVASAALMPWKTRFRFFCATLLSLSLSIATWGAAPGWIFIAGLPILIFSMLGSALGAKRAQMMFEAPRSLTLALAAGTTLTALTVIILTGEPLAPTAYDISRTPRTVIEGAAGTLLGIIGFTALFALACRQFPKLKLQLAYFGRLSIYIFLPHILFTAGARITLLALGIENIGMHLVVGTLIGVGGPLVLYRVARRIAPWLYTPPWPHR